MVMASKLVIQIPMSLPGRSLHHPTCNAASDTILLRNSKSRVFRTRVSRTNTVAIDSKTELTTFFQAPTECIVGSSGVPHHKSRCRLTTNAFPPSVSAAVAISTIGAAVIALTRLNRTAGKQKTECLSCQGSGLCPTCKGEGYVLKDLSAEAILKARANARDAATRNTAGLPKKWNYCYTCSGSRGCRECEGRGWMS